MAISHHELGPHGAAYVAAHDYGHHGLGHGVDHGFDYGLGHVYETGFDYGHGDLHHGGLLPHTAVVDPHQGPLVVHPHELHHDVFHPTVGEHRRDVQYHEEPFRHAAAEAHAYSTDIATTTGYMHPGFEPDHEIGLHHAYWGGDHHEDPHHTGYWTDAHHASPLADHHGYGHHGDEWATHGTYPEHHAYSEHHDDHHDYTHVRPLPTDHHYRFEQPHQEDDHYLHEDHYTPGLGHGYDAHHTDHPLYEHGFETAYYDPFAYGIAHHGDDGHHIDDYHHLDDHHVNPQAIHEAFEAAHGQDHVVYGEHDAHIIDAHHDAPVHHADVHAPVHHDVHHDVPAHHADATPKADANKKTEQKKDGAAPKKQVKDDVSHL